MALGNRGEAEVMQKMSKVGGVQVSSLGTHRDASVSSLSSVVTCSSVTLAAVLVELASLLQAVKIRDIEARAAIIPIFVFLIIVFPS